MTRYLCCDERRRTAVLAEYPPFHNGIDFLEVRDGEDLPLPERQTALFVRFLRPLAPGAVTPDHVRIEGGVRIPEVPVVATTVSAEDPHVLVVEVADPGDFSLYTLTLAGTAAAPLPWLDPALSVVSFSFKVACPSDFDCAPVRECPPAPRDEPEIDYLAKDYHSFRRLMLDRMAALAPHWRERNPADLGVTLVELLAYVGDHLSYEQDAVAMEAYLGTARRRVSVRRHARLVDYAMHDGANARAFVHLETRADGVTVPARTQLLTRVEGEPARLEPGGRALDRVYAASPVVFETMEPVTLYTAHAEIRLHTWSDRRCCLPAGATRATLAGALYTLSPGDLLLFEEVVGPRTGEARDADPTHRHVVRLTAVEVTEDPIEGVLVTEVAWGPDDALPFPLCISSEADRAQGRALVEDVSVARGNLVVADHGRDIATLHPDGDALGPVPAPDARFAPVGGARPDRCDEDTTRPPPPRFRPRLREGPVSQRAMTAAVVDGRAVTVPYDPGGPAAAVLAGDPRRALPDITLVDDRGVEWRPRRDLLASEESAPEFTVEVDDDGGATVRFGDDVNGLRPAADTVFDARYRVGNGAAGNIGADALFHVVTADDDVLGARNPLPARGGVDPEPLERVRQMAPAAFRTTERAVTPDDYVEVAERHPEVQRAAATLRWTGSWHTMFVTVDRRGGREVDADFEADLRAHLERFRLAGHDVEIDGPVFVPLEIAMTICVAPDHHRSHVKRALLELFGDHTLPDGRRGVFHPDHFTFGQPVYQSRLYSAAHAVQGVRSVEFTLFRRLHEPTVSGLESGLLEMGRLEIARLDDDPNFPDRGRLHLEMRGGR